MEPNATTRTRKPRSGVRVTLLHASLEHTPYRLLIGHLSGLPFHGAERRYDERSGGMLSRARALDQYPSQLGELLSVGSSIGENPQAAVIVGLGQPGELTPSSLTAIATRAMARIVHQSSERDIRISAVLLGSSMSGGLAVADSVAAMVEGLLSANALADEAADATPHQPRSRIVELQLVERYADRLELAASALSVIDAQRKENAKTADSTRPAPEVITIVPQPRLGEGRSTANPPIDGAHDLWRRVIINDQGDGDQRTLTFTSLGRLARAEQLTNPMQFGEIEPFLQRAIRDTSNSGLSTTLFEMLVPHEFKGELSGGDNLHLIVNSHTALYPWELLATRAQVNTTSGQLALRVGMLRQFESVAPRYGILRASGFDVLVVGNPPTGDPAYPSLTGAIGEAQQVVKTLSDAACRPYSLIWDDAGQPVDGTDTRYNPSAALQVANALYQQDWRIIHIAGHGDVSDDPTKFGVLLGDGQFLTAAKLKALRVVPDVVFLNCCHLGTAGGQSLSGARGLAAGVAESLLEIGVRAVIAAGWAVDDVAASAFATTLYNQLLTVGADLGQAVKEARTAASKASETVTWGAYQCYGDPSFRLTPEQPAPDEDIPHTLTELTRRVRRLNASISDRRIDAKTSPMRARLDDFRGAADKMPQPNAVYADLADGYAELGAFREAIRLYERATTGSDDAPLRALEQRANLIGRDLLIRRRKGVLTEADHAQLADAERLLDMLVSFGPTADRLAMLGGFHKRRAVVADDEVHRLDAVRASVAALARAVDVSYGDPYASNNWKQMHCIGEALGIADLSSPTVAARRQERRDLSRPENFWDRAAKGDFLLTVTLLGGPGALPQMVEAYGSALSLRSTPRERESVLGHLNELDELLPVGHVLKGQLAGAARKIMRAARET